MRGWLVGCQLKNQVLPLGKEFVPQTVVWYNFLVTCFFPGKKGGKNQDCVGLYFPPRAGVWVFGFYNDKQIKKKSYDTHYQFSIKNSFLKQSVTLTQEKK